MNTPLKYADSNYSNDVRSVTVNLVNSPPMNLLIVDVRYKQYGVTRKLRTEDYTLLESWLRRAYPVKTLNVSWAYRLPSFKNKITQSIVGGWNLSGISTWSP